MGCGIFAPLQPLPPVDAGVDGDAMEANPAGPEPGNEGGVTDGAPEVLTDGPMEAAYDTSEAGEVGTPPDPGKDAALEVGDFADAGDAGGEDDGVDAAGGGDAGDTIDAGDGGDAGGAIDAVLDAPSDVPGDGANGGDAGSPPDAGPDAGPPVVACDSSMPFGEPVLVYGLNRSLGTDQRISLSPDELTAYVSSGGFMGLTHLSVATRASRVDPFGPLMPLHQLDGPGHEIQPTVTGDGLRLFFDNDYTGVGRIEVATRQSTSEPFGPPVMVQIAGVKDHFSPYVLPDGSALYFNSNEDGPVAVYRVDLQGTTPGPPTAVWTRRGQVVVVSGDELTLYYATDGAPGEVFGDIWVTTRPSRDVAFGEPTIVTGVNTSYDEFPQWISPDGCRLYLGRSTTDTDNYLFVAERIRN
jgi:hypothetical protein